MNKFKFIICISIFTCHISNAHADVNTYIVGGIATDNIKIKPPHSGAEALKLFSGGIGVKFNNKYSADIIIHNIHNPHFTVTGYYKIADLTPRINIFALGGMFMPLHLTHTEQVKVIYKSHISYKHGYILGAGVSYKLKENIFLETQFEHYLTRTKTKYMSNVVGDNFPPTNKCKHNLIAIRLKYIL